MNMTGTSTGIYSSQCTGFLPRLYFSCTGSLPQILGDLKVPLVGTLNLCLEQPDHMEIKFCKSDHFGLRKCPQSGKVLLLFNFIMAVHIWYSCGY